MSAKQEATYHGADIVTRLRLRGPESDYNGIMGEAADEITELRAKVEGLEARHAFFRDRYSEAVRTINREADLHAHCDVSQECDE